MAENNYKRVLLKLSGEALAGSDGNGISPQVIHQFAEDIKEAYDSGVQIGIVIGGGNIFRGIAASAQGMDRASSDYMGMLATCINSLALQDALEKFNVDTRVQSAIEMNAISEPYIRRKAIRHLEKGRIVIFAAGTGNPYFTTDTAAALRAMEINDKDPVTNDDAVLFEQINYIDVLNKNLKVMDSTAISLCMDNKLPIRTFNLTVKGNTAKVISGENIGTLVD